MVNVAVFVSGGGTNLQALIDSEKSGKLAPGHISLVLSSNPDAYALTRARENDIEAYAISRRDCPSQQAFEEALLETLAAHRIELIVLAGFMCILSADFVARYPSRIINVHPSLIPSFCGKGFYGLRVHQAALDYGVKVTGATVHLVNEIPDGGEILLQQAVEILPEDTPELLQRRVMEQAEWKLLPRAVRMLCQQYDKGDTR